jgi:hypothetical protein
MWGWGGGGGCLNLCGIVGGKVSQSLRTPDPPNYLMIMHPQRCLDKPICYYISLVS